MKAIDMTPIIKKYPGYFVALSYDRKKVLGKGHTPKEARQKRKEENKRRNQLILSLTRVRENDKNYEIKYENHILLETAKSPI